MRLRISSQSAMCPPQQLTLVQAIPSFEALRPLQCSDESVERWSNTIVSLRGIARKRTMPGCCARSRTAWLSRVDSPILGTFKPHSAWVVVGTQPHKSAVEWHGDRHSNRHEDDHEEGCEDEREEEFEHGGGYGAWDDGSKRRKPSTENL